MEKTNKIKEAPSGAKNLIEIELEDGTTAYAYLKPIPRHTLEAALGHMTAAQPRVITAGELIFNSCVFKDAMDERINQDEDLKTSFFMKCVELIEIRTGTIKKL